MHGLAAVLFDLDDTLLDRRRSIERYLAGHASRAALSPAVAAAYQTRFRELDANGYASRSTVFSGLSAEFPAIGSAEALGNDFREYAWNCCEFVEGAADLLLWCRTIGLRSAIVTNGSSEMQRAKLRALKLADRVDVILVSEEEGVSKPAAEIFQRAANRLSVSIAACVFVGDNPHADVDGARRAGMVDVWLQREFPWPTDLAGASHSITSLAALPRLLDSL